MSEGDVKVEPTVRKEMEAEGFRIITLPEVTNCVRAKFPYINTLSILIAIKKVYPAMEYYIHVSCNIIYFISQCLPHDLRSVMQMHEFHAENILT